MTESGLAETLTPAMLRHLEQRLLEERARLVAALETYHQQTRETPAAESGEVSSVHMHLADMGTDSEERELEASNAMRQTAELAEIDAALERLYRSPGQFGRCEHTGELIPLERLEVVPWARTCVQPSGAPPLAAKVAFLKRPESYPPAESPAAVEAVETHMAWVFLTDRHAYKLKKPVRYPFLDFTTLASRRFHAEAEVRLNARLAPGVYRGVVALTVDREGRLALDGDGASVDWLVKMRRLPRERMLDFAIAAQTVDATDGATLRAVAELLAAFHRAAPRVPLSPAAYRRRLRAEVEASVAALAVPRYGLPGDALARIARAQRAFLDRRGQLLDARAAADRIVDGHGDLRPEHVALGPPPAVIDRVEFNRDFRILDGLDELAYLAMECERLGAPSVGAALLFHYVAASGDPAPDPLIRFYQSVRATLRAKLAVWHLDDPVVLYPSQWLNRANAYLTLAERYLRET